MTTTQIPLADLILDDERVQIRTGTKSATVERYADSADLLPPIDVFRTTIEETDDDGETVTRDGYLVADGFHRVKAFQSLGRETIAANVHEGTIEDAEEFAAVANATSGLPLTNDERNAAIRRLHHLHPTMRQAEIAQRMSVSEALVSRVIRIDRVRGQVPEAAQLSDAHVAEILTAPADQRAALAKAAAKNEWTRAQTRDAVTHVKDDGVLRGAIRDMLSGKIEPTTLREPAPDSDEPEPLPGLSQVLSLLVEMEADDIAANVEPEIIRAARDALTGALEGSD